MSKKSAYLSTTDEKWASGEWPSRLEPGLKAGQRLDLIGNAHIDPVWLWRWQEGFHEIRATFRSALDRMKEYPQFVFISSSAAFYEWLETCDPKMFAEIRLRVQEGRWGIVGGWWIEPDCNLPAGELFARQGLYGQRYFKEKFGVTARVGYNVDSFGHNGVLPQILRKSGLEYYVFMRPMPHEKGLPGRLFWWEADDGSRVLAFQVPFEYCTWEPMLEGHLERCAAEMIDPAEQMMCFYGVGNHGGGPTRENLDTILQKIDITSGPELVFSTPDRFFQDACAAEELIPVVHDELQHHSSGCYAAHSGIKRWNRKAENLLLAAERLSSLAEQVTGLPYPRDFQRAWKNVLFNQFHDILAGTSIEPAYEDAQNQFGEAISIGERALNLAVQALAWNIQMPYEEDTRPIVVVNPHAFPVKSFVEVELSGKQTAVILVDAQGSEVAVQRIQSLTATNGKFALGFLAELPSLGYQVYRVKVGEADRIETDLRTTGHSIENGSICLEINPETGCICSLWDLRWDIETLSGEGARPVVVQDDSDTWSHNVFRFDQAIGVFKPSSIRLTETGPARGTLRVESEYAQSRLVQEFSLYSGASFVDVKVTVDWREQHKMLKLRFPANLVHIKATYEIPYGSMARAANGDEEPGQSWVDLSGVSRDSGKLCGLSLINDAKYSYDINGSDLGLTVLRSPIYAHHLPVVPDPDTAYSYIDQGMQTFHYRLLPHGGTWREAGLFQQAAEINQKPIVLNATFHPEGILPMKASYLAVEPENIHVTVLKEAEDGDAMVLRAFETHKKRTEATFTLHGWERTFQAIFGPGEIKTFSIPKNTKLAVAETDLLEW